MTPVSLFFFQKILLFLLLENKMQNINHQCEAAWPPRSLVQMFWAPCASCHGPRSEEEDGEGLGHDPTARRLWVRKWRTTRWVTSKGSCNPVYTETPTWHAGNYFGDPTSLHGLHNVPGAIRHHGGRAWEQHNISTLYSFGVDKSWPSGNFYFLHTYNIESLTYKLIQCTKMTNHVLYFWSKYADKMRTQ